MDISLIKTFLEVSKTRHFSHAADNLSVTSAGVSARVKLLESQLGVSLFVRRRGGVALTNEGEKLLPLAETMVNTWARAVQELSLRPEVESRIHIGATSSIWLLAMQDRLYDIACRHPEVALQAEGHSNEDLARLLQDKSMDLVLLPDPVLTEGFRSEKIGEVRLLLAGRGPETAKAALQDNYIYVDWGAAFAKFHADHFGDSIRPALHVNLVTIAIGIIERAGGAAYLPKYLVQETDWLTPVPKAPPFKRPIYACYQEDHPQTKLIRDMLVSLKGVSL